MLIRPSDISTQECVRRRIGRIFISRDLPAFQEESVQNYFNNLLRVEEKSEIKDVKVSILPMVPWFLTKMPSINRLVSDRLKLIGKMISLPEDPPSEALTAQHLAYLTDISGTFIISEIKEACTCTSQLLCAAGSRKQVLKATYQALEYEEKRTQL